MGAVLHDVFLIFTLLLGLLFKCLFASLVKHLTVETEVLYINYSVHVDGNKHHINSVAHYCDFKSLKCNSGALNTQSTGEKDQFTVGFRIR